MLKVLKKAVQEAVKAGIVYVISSQSQYHVKCGQAAVVFDRFDGVKDGTVGEGSHFRLPWFQKVYTFDVRIRPQSLSSVALTKDLTAVTFNLRILSRPDVDQLTNFYKSSGMEYHKSALPFIGEEALNEVISKFTANQLVDERPQILAALRDSVERRARDFHIVVDDVAITSMVYGFDFSEAVERKAVAQHTAKTSLFIAKKCEYEKKAVIKKAEGESEAAKLISQATDAAQRGLIEVRRIEAVKDNAIVLAKGSNGSNVSYLPKNVNLVLDD